MYAYIYSVRVHIFLHLERTNLFVAAIMGNNIVYTIGFTCRPHYEYEGDTDHCWMTREGQVDINRIVSLWMPAENTLTLEDVARLMDKLAASEVDLRLESFIGRINNMTFHSQTIPREQMRSLLAKDYIYEGESFTANLTASRRVKQRVLCILVLCPCFVCCTVDIPHHPAKSVTYRPTSQKLQNY